MTWLKPLIIDKDMDDAVFSGTGVFIPFMTINIQKRRYHPSHQSRKQQPQRQLTTHKQSLENAQLRSSVAETESSYCCSYAVAIETTTTHHTDMFFIAETTMTDSDPQKLGRHWRILETFFPSSKLHCVVQN